MGEDAARGKEEQFQELFEEEEGVGMFKRAGQVAKLRTTIAGVEENNVHGGLGGV